MITERLIETIAENFGKRLMEFLLEKQGSRESVLHWTMKKGYKTSVQLLLSEGEDIDAKALDGMTPLHLAAREGNEAIAHLLLEKGANIESKSTMG